MNETRELARFVVRTEYHDLPTEVVDRLRVYVLDNLAAGFVGSVQPWSRMVSDLARQAGGKREASLFNQPWRTDVSHAALVNGAMIGAFEMEHIAYAAHPSGAVFPAALAIAERERLDGKSFITALALGYEVNCRIAQAQTNAVESERGFHNPAVNGVFGAAAAVSKLLHLDEPTMLNALGIAGSHSSGLIEFAWEGAMTKRLHLGRASQMGLESALLARGGFTGPSTILEGRYGYFHAFSPRPEIEKLLADLGKRWLLRDIIIKPYGCHLSSQAIVQRLQDFRKDLSIDTEAISRVSVSANPHFTEGRFASQAPESILGAQYSMPFTVAVALLRDMSDPTVYSESTLWDTAIRRLAARVQLIPDERFNRYQYDCGAEVVIDIKDGGREIINVEDFKGSFRQPMSFDDVTEKFLRITEKLATRRRANRMVETVSRLEGLPDVADLARLIRGKTVGRA